MEAVVNDHDYLEKPILECMADNMVQVNIQWLFFVQGESMLNY